MKNIRATNKHIFFIFIYFIYYSTYIHSHSFISFSKILIIFFSISMVLLCKIVNFYTEEGEFKINYFSFIIARRFLVQFLTICFKIKIVKNHKVSWERFVKDGRKWINLILKIIIRISPQDFFITFFFFFFFWLIV